VSATKLLDAWEPAKGNFVAQLETAGRGSATWSTDLSAVNAVSDALFYVEKQVKDMKLGRPLGLLECASATCPEALESRYAHRSKQHIRNNLVGFGKLFAGCGTAGEGKGLEDLLIASGASDLAQRVANALSGAVAAVDAIEEDDLEEALAKDYASVKALHEAIKVLTDLLKNELVIVLGVELPKTVEGDND
jgi:predicted lipoprotein